MATFKVPVSKIFIKPHPNAEKLELGNIDSPDGFQVVVGKGLYKTGDVVAYIGENAVVPEEILKEYGYWNIEKDIGMLAGSKGTRVKAIKLRGEFSLGIVLPMISTNQTKVRFRHVPGHLTDVNVYYELGDDVSERLGVTKYEAPIPTQMAGEVWNAAGYTIKYDIENQKRYPDVLQDGEQVVMTEKLHGTWCCFGYHPEIDSNELPDGVGNNFIVTSKGLSEKGLALKHNEANKHNLYMRALENTRDNSGLNIAERALYIFDRAEPFYILGEIFGKGVQDLTYGDVAPQFRVFDIYVGHPGRGRYLNASELYPMTQRLNVEMVPVLYEGPFSKQMMDTYTDGKDTISNVHMREGVVMKPIVERYDSSLGRVILKSVSQAYLLRKGDTTEFS